MPAILFALFGRLKAVPWQIWAAIGAIILLGVAACSIREDAYADGRAYEKKTWEKRLETAHADALARKAKTEKRATQISQDIRSKHEATLRDDSARADDLRLRGPGAARCGPGDNPRPATATGGHEPPGGGADATPGGLSPADGLAAVPWGWLVDRAEQCDANRSEVLAWREFHARQSAAVGVTPAP